MAHRLGADEVIQERLPLFFLFHIMILLRSTKESYGTATTLRNHYDTFLNLHPFNPAVIFGDTHNRRSSVLVDSRMGKQGEPFHVRWCIGNHAGFRRKLGRGLPSLSAHSGRLLDSPTTFALLGSSIQAPVLNGFGDVRRLNVLGAGKVGDGAGDFQHAAVGPRAQAKFVDRRLQQLLRIIVH